MLLVLFLFVDLLSYCDDSHFRFSVESAKYSILSVLLVLSACFCSLSCPEDEKISLEFSFVVVMVVVVE